MLKGASSLEFLDLDLINNKMNDSMDNIVYLGEGIGNLANLREL